MDRLSRLLLFADVIECGSFAAAARARRTSRAVVAKQLGRLEEDLGARLLHRSTRRMSPTDLGRRLYRHAKRIRQEAREVDALVESTHEQVTGVLRITSVVHFGRRYVQPVATRFALEHPRVTVEIELEDQIADVVGSAFDIAIRIGHAPDSTLLSRKLADVDVVLCASPGYLAEHGAPKHPEQLEQHACVVYAANETTVDRWHYEDDGAVRSVRVSGGYRVNDGEMLLDAVKRGVGIGLIPAFLAFEALKTGEVVAVLPRFKLPAYAPLHAVYPARKHLPTKTRAFLDALIAYVGSPPRWQRADFQG